MLCRALVLISLFLGLAEARAEEPALDSTAAQPGPDATAEAPASGSSLLADIDAAVAEAPLEAQVAAPARPMAVEYSDGYRTRLKIHKYARYATLPLFAAQFAVGQKLYDGNASDSTRSAHTALAVGTGVLFGVNTVTGVWNLSEGRKDPNHKTKRMVHGILMAVADAGFVATGALAPESEEGSLDTNSNNRSTHRTVALTSMGVATVAYLIMLIH